MKGRLVCSVDGSIRSGGRLVKIGKGKQVLSVIADIIHVQGKVTPEGSLYAEVPIENHRIFELRRHTSDRSRW